MEETRRAIYLQPRNFNPHPYQLGRAADVPATRNRGPVLFPETPPDPDDPNGNSSKINLASNSHPIDNHPYAPLVRKNKYKQAGRFQVSVILFKKHELSTDIKLET